MIKEEFDSLWTMAFGPGTPDGSARYIQQDETELRELCQRLADLNPQKGLEIGNACGGTTLFWQSVAPLVVSIDLESINVGNGSPFRDHLTDVKFLLGSSHDQEILTQAEEFAPYDFLFIDGDHTIEGVKQDYDMYAPLVRKGGIVAFHDWGYQEGAPSHRWPIRDCIATTGITPEILQHSHFGIAVLYV